MADKDFSGINTQHKDTGTSSGQTASAINRGKDDQHHKQTAAGPEEKLRRQKGLKTQGRTDCAQYRLNVVLSPDNREYLTTMARATGQTYALYLNNLLDHDREINMEFYLQSKKLLENITKAHLAELQEKAQELQERIDAGEIEPPGINHPNGGMKKPLEGQELAKATLKYTEKKIEELTQIIDKEGNEDY